MGPVKTPVSLGIQYYSDDLHFRAQDFELWVPELQSMGLRWLVLSGALDCAVPEAFLKGLVDAGIEPLLLLDRGVIRPADETLPWMLRAYRRAGVRFIAPFPAPNLCSSWPSGVCDIASPVGLFVDIFAPVAEAILAEGITPVFPMMDPAGTYWGPAFLEAFLIGMDKSGKSDLVRKIAVAFSASAYNRPLDWGAGGSARWPEARPYLTPPGSQDHLGFQGYAWYDETIRRALGQSLPMIGLQAGAVLGDMTDPSFPVVEPSRHAEINLQVAQIAAGGQFTAPLLCLCFRLLTAAEGSAEAALAWYRNDGSTLPIVELLKRRMAAKTQKYSAPAKKFFHHYLLLPQDPFSLSGRMWEQVRGFLLAFQPVCGFSLEEACQAEKVTILGEISGAVTTLRLRDSGCHVEYLAMEAK
jgi:hypothetical protein